MPRSRRRGSSHRPAAPPCRRWRAPRAPWRTRGPGRCGASDAVSRRRRGPRRRRARGVRRAPASRPRHPLGLTKRACDGSASRRDDERGRARPLGARSACARGRRSRHRATVEPPDPAGGRSAARDGLASLVGSEVGGLRARSTIGHVRMDVTAGSAGGHDRSGGGDGGTRPTAEAGARIPAPPSCGPGACPA